jgi:hypothetical protein
VYSQATAFNNHLLPDDPDQFPVTYHFSSVGDQDKQDIERTTTDFNAAPFLQQQPFGGEKLEIAETDLVRNETLRIFNIETQTIHLANTHCTEDKKSEGRHSSGQDWG